MAGLAQRRPLQGRLHRALLRNLALAAPGRPLPRELAGLLREADRPGQALLLHASRYLAGALDARAARLLPWPLLDKASERTYKTQLLAFVSAYYAKDAEISDDRWLTPILPSYLVNAGGFKVIQLLFEMSQLSLKKSLAAKYDAKDDRLKELEFARYAKSPDDLYEQIIVVKDRLRSKAEHLKEYRRRAKSIADKYIALIKDLEDENAKQKELMNSFIDLPCLKAQCETESNDLKNVNYSGIFLQYWWDLTDDILTESENEWDNRVAEFLSSTKLSKEASESTVIRTTIKSNTSHMIEYHPKDKINSDKLESQVTSQQRYILKNIVRDNKLSFPNLLRAYAVAMCYLFKNVRCSEQTDMFNCQMSVVSASTGRFLEKSKILLDNMHSLELKLQNEEKAFESSLTEEDLDAVEIIIPPLPDLRFRDDTWQNPTLDKCFTPLNMSKIRFNIRNFFPAEIKQPKALFQVPSQIISRQTFSKNMAKLHADDLNVTNVSNISKMSLPAKDKLNETTDCSTVFTKQQINRLLSCRKTSSSKKFKSAQKSSHGKAKRSCLFSETPDSSFALIRSQSSPNLCLTSDLKKKLPQGYLSRNLSAIAQEPSPDRISEISGVVRLLNSRNCTPQKDSQLKDYTSMPIITITKPEFRLGQNQTLGKLDIGLDSMVDILINQPSNTSPVESKTVIDHFKTPCNAPSSEKKKSNSMDRLIERFKRISQATRAPKIDEFKTPTLSPINDKIIEDKENDLNEINVNTSFSPRLPDLVSPSCNLASKLPEDDLETEWPIFETPEAVKGKYKCRESLGTALGVDISYLDKNDLMIPE